MELHNLKPALGSVKKRKRIARGPGSGHGGTSTRGHKGAKSRSGYSRKRNFEGGQMPLQMRVPKRGFKNPNRVDYVPLNLSRLQAISEKFNLKEITMETLVASGIVKKTDKVKVLGRGELKASLSVNVHGISDSAKSAIEGAGGSVNLIKPAQTKSEKFLKKAKVVAAATVVEEAPQAIVPEVTETIKKTEVVTGDDPEFDLLMSDKVEESGTIVNTSEDDSPTISEEEE